MDDAHLIVPLQNLLNLLAAFDFFVAAVKMW